MTPPIQQSKYVNVVVITGKVLQTPELRYTAAGRAVTTIRVACHFSYVNDEGRRVHDSEYHYVKATGELAIRCTKWVQAGTEVYIEAHLKTRGWVQAATGRTITRTAILAERIVELPAVPPKQLVQIVVRR